MVKLRTFVRPALVLDAILFAFLVGILCRVTLPALAGRLRRPAPVAPAEPAPGAWAREPAKQYSLYRVAPVLGKETEDAEEAPLSSPARGMALVPGGTFVLGADNGDPDERPAHPITLAPFELDRTEVTVADYRACVQAGGCSAPAPTVYWDGITPEAQDGHSRACNWDRPGRERHPVNCVTWSQARAYCTWAGKRLPTEAEWEAAARSPTGRTYPWGDRPPGPGLLNACDRACARHYGVPAGAALTGESDGWATSAPVGSYPAGATPEGLLDMAGNVWEWTASRYCPYEHPECDEPRRVVRGGAWNVSRGDVLRSAYRFRSPPSFRYDLVGLRCARTPR